MQICTSGFEQLGAYPEELCFTIGPITAGVVGVVYGGAMLIGGQDAINDSFNGDWNEDLNNKIKHFYGR